MRVFLEKSGRRVELKAHQARLFGRKLFWTRLLGIFFNSARGYYEGIAANLKVIVDRGGRSRDYFIHARAVLYDPRKDRSYQFYFGLLLIEWFNDAVRP